MEGDDEPKPWKERIRDRISKEDPDKFLDKHFDLFKRVWRFSFEEAVLIMD